MLLIKSRPRELPTNLDSIYIIAFVGRAADGGVLTSIRRYPVTRLASTMLTAEAVGRMRVTSRPTEGFLDARAPGIERPEVREWAPRPVSQNHGIIPSVTLPLTAREAVRDVEEICRLDLKPKVLRRRVGERLGQLMTASAWGFATVDPKTLLLCDEVSAGLSAESALASLHNEYLTDDVMKFSTLARSPVVAGTLSTATGGEPERSSRYRTVLPLIDARHELRASLVVSGRCWGAIGIYRSGAEPDFSAVDVAVLQRLSAPLGAALRRSARHAAAAVGHESTGVILLDQRLRLVSHNAAAEQWLDELVTFPGRLPVAVLDVAVRGQDTALPARGRVRGRSGRWLSVQASTLSGGDADGPAIAVTIHPASSTEVAELLHLSYDLTAREREVAALVVAGMSSRAIAAELHITANTVQDHLKGIFTKTGVRSRRELAATIMGISPSPLLSGRE